MPFALFLLGYVVDSQLDKIGASPKAPSWFKEIIPDITVFSSHTVQSGTDESGAPVTVEKTKTVTVGNAEPPKP
jgi:hypothetical protein